MTRDQLVDRCEARFRDTANTVITASEWADYVNDAYLEVAAARPDWPFLETRNEALVVAQGTGSVALPADGWRVQAVYNKTDEWPLVPIPGQSDYRRWYPDPESNLGSAQYYRMRANNIEVYPWVSAATTLHVDLLIPPTALGAADEPVFPEQYHRILVYGALALAYEDEEADSLHRRAQARYDRLLANMIQDLLSPRTEGYPEIVDNF